VAAVVAAVMSVATTLVVLRLVGPDASTRPTAELSPGAGSVAGAAAALDLAGLFARVSSGVVRIETTACVRGGAGSGFLVAPDLVATAAHVVDGAHAIVLRRDDGTGVEGRVIGLDTVHDVALVRADHALDGHVFRFATQPPRVGAEVAALGYALAGPLVPLRRTVTGLDQSLDVSGTAGAPAEPDAVVGELIRVDGGFQAGDSGGPVLAPDGRVVGLVEGRSLADRDTGYAVAATRAAGLVSRWRTQTTPIDVSDSCAAPVGPPRSRVVVRDASGNGIGGLVAAFFGTYASAINSARYEEAWEMLTQNARGGQTLAEWADAERSSQIFDAVVREVEVLVPGASPTPAAPTAAAAPTAPTPAAPTAAAPTPAAPTAAAQTPATGPVAPGPVLTPGTGGSVRTLVEFSSIEQDRVGGGGPTCSRWRLTYTLVRGPSRWQVDVAALAPGYPRPC
jgi:hypothetical protein